MDTAVTNVWTSKSDVECQAIGCKNVDAVVSDDWASRCGSRCATCLAVQVLWASLYQVTGCPGGDVLSQIIGCPCVDAVVLLCQMISYPGVDTVVPNRLAVLVWTLLWRNFGCPSADIAVPND